MFAKNLKSKTIFLLSHLCINFSNSIIPQSCKITFIKLSHSAFSYAASVKAGIPSRGDLFLPHLHYQNLLSFRIL